MIRTFGEHLGVTVCPYLLTRTFAVFVPVVGYATLATCVLMPPTGLVPLQLYDGWV